MSETHTTSETQPVIIPLKRCGNCVHEWRIDRRGICRLALYDAIADAIWNRGDVKCGKWELGERT